MERSTSVNTRFGLVDAADLGLELVFLDTRYFSSCVNLAVDDEPFCTIAPSGVVCVSGRDRPSTVLEGAISAYND